MFIHLLPFCVSQFSIYLSQYFSRSFSFSMQWRGFCHVSRQTWPKHMASISCKTLRGWKHRAVSILLRLRTQQDTIYFILHESHKTACWSIQKDTSTPICQGKQIHLTTCTKIVPIVKSHRTVVIGMALSNLNMSGTWTMWVVPTGFARVWYLCDHIVIIVRCHIILPPHLQ